MINLPVTVPLWRKCSFRGRWLITCGHDTVFQAPHWVSPFAWGPGCVVTNPRVDSDCSHTDSSVSSLKRSGALWKPSHCCALRRSYALSDRRGGDRRLRATVFSTRRGYRAPRLSLGLEWRPSPRWPTRSYVICLRLLLSAPLLASVQLRRFPCSSPPGQSPLQLRGSAHAVPPAWNGSWGHLLRPLSPGLGRAFLNHPPQWHPTHPLLLTSFVCFSLNLVLRALIISWHFISLFSYFLPSSFPTKKKAPLKSYALLIVLLVLYYSICWIYLSFIN